MDSGIVLTGAFTVIALVEIGYGCFTEENKCALFMEALGGKQHEH